MSALRGFSRRLKAIEIRRVEQPMKQIRCVCSILLASMVFLLVLNAASAVGRAAIRSPGRPYLQESLAAPAGKLNVPARMMASRCVTMVSPTYPQTTDNSQTPSTVIVRVVIWKSGNVSPLWVISGQSALESAAMNAVSLWKFRPFDRDGVPLDVTTDIPVDFDPAKPGGVVTHPNH